MLRTVAAAALWTLLLAPGAFAETIDWITTREALLYDRTDPNARVVATLPPRTIVEVVDVTDVWIRVRSTRGRADGFLRRADAEPHHGPKRGVRQFRRGIFRLTDPAIVRAAPALHERRVTTVPAGTHVLVVDRSGNWYRIESQSGKRPGGWIPVISAKRVRDPAGGRLPARVR